MATVKPVDVEQLRQLFSSDKTIDDICKELGVTKTQLRALAQQHKLRKKYPAHTRKLDMRFHAEPTPEEIAEIEARKAEVRARWSEKEEEAKYTGPKRQAWEMPSFSYDSRTISFSEENNP